MVTKRKPRTAFRICRSSLAIGAGSLAPPAILSIPSLDIVLLPYCLTRQWQGLFLLFYLPDAFAIAAAPAMTTISLMKLQIPSFILACLFANCGFAEMVNFDNARPGGLPAGWLGGATGQGTPRWSLEADASAPSRPNALRQSGEAAYPWCVNTNIALKDGFVEVKFKAIAGSEDQAGGVVWRYQDRDNYYVVRANALENNVRIYHFTNGKRTQFKGVNLPVAANQWHTLRVEFSGSHFVVSFNGKMIFEADDDQIGRKGAAGVWTKADSVTLFDDFSYGSK